MTIGLDELDPPQPRRERPASPATQEAQEPIPDESGSHRKRFAILTATGYVRLAGMVALVVDQGTPGDRPLIIIGTDGAPAAQFAPGMWHFMLDLELVDGPLPGEDE